MQSLNIPLLKPPSPNKRNSHRGNAYTSLDRILRYLAPTFKELDYRVSWDYEVRDGVSFCVCTLSSPDGFATSSYPIVVEGDPLKMGAINTYAKRQSLRNLLGWANDPQEDPDHDDSPYGKPRGFTANH